VPFHPLTLAANTGRDSSLYGRGFLPSTIPRQAFYAHPHVTTHPIPAPCYTPPAAIPTCGYPHSPCTNALPHAGPAAISRLAAHTTRTPTPPRCTTTTFCYLLGRSMYRDPRDDIAVLERWCDVDRRTTHIQLLPSPSHLFAHVGIHVNVGLGHFLWWWRKGAATAPPTNAPTDVRLSPSPLGFPLHTTAYRGHADISPPDVRQERGAAAFYMPLDRPLLIQTVNAAPFVTFNNGQD